MRPIRVLINGAKGRMGSESARAVEREEGLELAGQADREDNLSEVLSAARPDVVVDFTTPDVVFENARQIIEAGARPVIGTTGLKPQQIAELQQRCGSRKLGGLIAPNFAVGAVLLMKFAAEAARYLPQVEIIELHHDRKLDAPSGTAIKTAELIAANRAGGHEPAAAQETVAGARGGLSNGIRVHSVRLPGLVAHQEVIFGGLGQVLTLRHDSLNRESFMPGVCLACKKVMELQELVYGLEKLL